jgi:hypothetical protein
MRAGLITQGLGWVGSRDDESRHNPKQPASSTPTAAQAHQAHPWLNPCAAPRWRLAYQTRRPCVERVSLLTTLVVAPCGDAWRGDPQDDPSVETRACALSVRRTPRFKVGHPSMVGGALAHPHEVNP